MPWIWIVLIAFHLLSLMALAGYEFYTLYGPGEPLTHWVRDVLFEVNLIGTILMVLFAVYWAGLVAFALWLGPHWLVDRPFARDKRVEPPYPTRRV